MPEIDSTATEHGHGTGTGTGDKWRDSDGLVAATP